MPSMRHIIPALALVFSLTGAAPARPSVSPADLARIQALTLEGLECAYRMDFADANRRFDEALAIEPLHPRPYAGKTTMFFWQCLLSNKEEDRRQFLALADRAIESGIQYIDTYGEDADALTALGILYGQRSFVHGRAKSYLKAAWDGKKSYDYFYDAVKRDPRAYDAYMGLGVYHYITTFLPKTLQWITSILGISGDCDRGIREIRITAEKGLYHRVEAQYYLAQFLPWSSGDFTSGEKIVNGLLLKYPSNTILRLTRAVWEIQRNDVASAKDDLVSILRWENEPVKGIRNYSGYKLGECLFRLGEYSRAIDQYGLFLKEYREEVYVATSNYRIGLCYEMTSRRDSALEYYRRSVKAATRFGDDAHSARSAAERLRSPLTPADTLLITGQNLLRAGRYDDALGAFTPLAGSGEPPGTIKAEALYGLGETRYQKGDFERALQLYEEVLAVTLPEKDQWVYPWARYQRGLCYVKLGNRDAARREFNAVLQYDDYDFKHWLEFRTERELGRIKQ